MQEGKTQCEATVQSESRAFSPRRRISEGGEERDGAARLNNVLEISVQECTINVQDTQCDTPLEISPLTTKQTKKEREKNGDKGMHQG